MLEFIRDRARYYNCPVCGRSLKGCEIRMLSHVEERYTVQVTCAACRVTFIVILAIQGPLPEAVEASDGEAVEAVAGGPGPIESDEVLDVHLLLRDFQGSLVELLQQPDPSR